MRKKEIMVILSDTNLALLKKIEDTDGGSNANISDLIVMLRCLLAGVVRVQSWIPE